MRRIWEGLRIHTNNTVKRIEYYYRIIWDKGRTRRDFVLRIFPLSTILYQKYVKGGKLFNKSTKD